LEVVYCGSLKPFEVTFGHEAIKRDVNPSGPSCATCLVEFTSGLQHHNLLVDKVRELFKLPKNLGSLLVITFQPQTQERQSRALKTRIFA